MPTTGETAAQPVLVEELRQCRLLLPRGEHRQLGHLLHPGCVTVVVAFVAGLFGPAVTGGWSSRLSHGDAAIARRLTVFDASSYSATGLNGPGLAGLAYAAVGPVAPLVLSIGFLLLGAAVAPAAHRSPYPHPPPSPRSRFLATIGTGLGTVAGSRRLLAATCSSFVTYTGVGFFTVALPLIGAARFGSAGHGSMLLMVMPAMALVANAVLSRLDALGSPLLVLILATLVSAVGLLAMSLPWAMLVLAGIVLARGTAPSLPPSSKSAGTSPRRQSVLRSSPPGRV